MKKLLGVLAVAVLLAVPGLAGELAGVTLPESAKVGDATLKLNGMGLRKKFIIKIYVGALYLKSPSKDVPAILNADEPMRMVMHFLYKEVEAEKITEAWTEGFANNSPEKARR
jgi:hypothetical protein